MNKAVFLDKDGTLIKDVPYNIDPKKVELEFYAIQALTQLQKDGYKLIIVSNQPGIALSFFDIDALEDLKNYIIYFFQSAGVHVSAFYYCPHYTQGSVAPYNIACDCRKPMPGMLLQAAKDLNIDLSASWMVGDILNDVEAGARAGCRTILINNGNETEWVKGQFRIPTFTVGDLKEMAEVITSLH